jgi:Leucine-rich repeat (LRR) protein
MSDRGLTIFPCRYYVPKRLLSDISRLVFATECGLDLADQLSARLVCKSWKKRVRLSNLELSSRKLQLFERDPSLRLRAINLICRGFCASNVSYFAKNPVPILIKHMKSATLLRNRSLTSINLSENFAFDEGADALARALTRNSTLKTLDVRSNMISEIGIRSLARSLESNSSLTHLDLTENAFSNKSAIDISESIAANSTILELKLDSSILKAVGVQALSRALHHNTSLREISLVIYK